MGYQTNQGDTSPEVTRARRNAKYFTIGCTAWAIVLIVLKLLDTDLYAAMTICAINAVGMMYMSAYHLGYSRGHRDGRQVRNRSGRELRKATDRP